MTALGSLRGVRVAVVAQESTGGIRSTLGWLRDGLRSRGAHVDVHMLATRIDDEHSTRVLSPASWTAPLGQGVPDGDTFRWGARWIEFEGRRYAPRKALTAALDTYDIVQVVAGTPAPALSVAQVSAPTFLLCATVLASERASRLSGMPTLQRTWKTATLPMIDRLEARAVRAVDHVFAMNHQLLGWVVDHGQSAVSYAPTGVDTAKFRPTGPWNPHAPVVCLGRLDDPRKNWPLAISAYALLRGRHGVTNRLLLGGSSPVPQGTVELIDELSIAEHVSIVADIPAAELPEFLGSGSLFLQTSREEGLGIAGLEAMACGLPMVATRTVGRGVLAGRCQWPHRRSRPRCCRRPSRCDGRGTRGRGGRHECPRPGNHGGELRCHCVPGPHRRGVPALRPCGPGGRRGRLNRLSPIAFRER